MQTIAYCGSPPVPGAMAWNLDPPLIACLIALGLAGMVLTWRLALAPLRRWALLCGWAVLSLALISPLCNLSVALFSARVGQHMLIAFMAAPLLAWGLPGTRKARSPLGAALMAAGPFAAALWFWHLPGPYDWTFRSDGAYWVMHVSLAVAAVLLWRLLLDARLPAASLVASGLTSLQMTVLGAVYTFAGRAVFAVHAGTTAPWGLSPLEDQQLGGLIMWIPTGIALAGGVVWTMAAMLSAQERCAVCGDLTAAQD